jgi:acyl-CoA thioesterase-2
MASSALDELIELMKLKKLETNIYEGDNHNLGLSRVFGGQVLGQALMAASYTVENDRYAHSFHAYFLRLGMITEPIYYEVEPIRSGKSFSTRTVLAKQHGRAIFTMTASFQKKEDGFEHASLAPKVKGPEGLRSEYERAIELSKKLPGQIPPEFLAKRPIEVRVVDPVDHLKPEEREPQKSLWMKADGNISSADWAIHAALLSYSSDFGLLGTSLLPHKRTYIDPKLQVASLDHAMWFHRPFRMDQWLLYTMESPSASGARGFNRGMIFTQDGKLVASTAQEGLIRKRDR